jgi:hypothetical protein
MGGDVCGMKRLGPYGAEICSAKKAGFEQEGSEEEQEDGLTRANVMASRSHSGVTVIDRFRLSWRATCKTDVR